MDKRTSNTGKRAASDDSREVQPRKMPPTIRKRAAMACDECRLRKRRCDAGVPICGACVKRFSICEYPTDSHLRDLRWRTIQSLRSQLEELENAELPVPSRTGRGGLNKEATPNAAQDTQCPDTWRTGSWKADERLSQPLHGDVPRSIESSYSQATISHVREEPSPSDASEYRRRARSILPGLGEGQESSVEIQQASENLEKMMEPIIHQISSDGRDSDFGTSASQHRPTSSASTIEQGTKKADCKCDSLLQARRQWFLPVRRVADSLVARYFARHHLAFPILHEQTFRWQYASLWDPTPTLCRGLCGQRSQGKLLGPTVYAVFTMASLFETDQPEENVRRASSFFRMAQDVDFLGVLDREVGLELIQWLLLIGRYLQSTEQISKWKNISSLTIRMAQSMGLHYSVDEARKRGLWHGPATQLDHEMRARVWYACVLLERDFPLYLFPGHSLGVVSSAYNPPLPQAIDDSRLSNEVGEVATQPEALPSPLVSFVETIKLHEVLSHTLDRHEHLPESSSDMAMNVQPLLKLDTLLNDWRDALPEHLQFKSPLDGAGQLDPANAASLQNSAFALPTPAKKMYLRYLHACQIILRPALELYFETTQNDQPSLRRKQRNGNLEVLVLTRMAAKCVGAAVLIIELLSAKSEADTFKAWWFNIAYLHTSGSTVLMARICTFHDVIFSNQSLVACWNTCLATLHSYAGVSSIAQRSHFLLQQSARRLVSIHAPPPTNERGAEMGDAAPVSVPNKEQYRDHDSQPPLKSNRVDATGAGPFLSDGQEVGRIGPLSRSRATGTMDASKTLATTAPSLDPYQDFILPPELNDNVWDVDLESSNWSLAPSTNLIDTFGPPFNL